MATRTTISFVYDKKHPDNNSAQRYNQLLYQKDNQDEILYGDITAEAGLYGEFGLFLLDKHVLKVGGRMEQGISASLHDLRIWEGIDKAAESSDFYDSIKDSGLTVNWFTRVKGVWEALWHFSGSFLSYEPQVGTPVNYYLVPTFNDLIASRNKSDKTTVDTSFGNSRTVLSPVSIGVTAVDSSDKKVDTKYSSTRYSYSNAYPKSELTLTNIPLKGKFTIKPMVMLFNHEIMASPEVLLEATNAAKVTDFKQTGSQYREGGFSHDGRTYDYKYDVAVTVQLEQEDTEGVEDWGYVYRDPDGQLAHISLRNYQSPYTDTRYVYYRNESPSTVTLYGYVKYEGEDGYVYDEPKDYPVQHSQTHCPDDNHPHWIDLGLPSGTQWRCCNEGASKPEDYGGYYQFGEVSSAPSLDQIKELLNNCGYTWTTLNGVIGGRFTGPSGGSIFLPAAGYVWLGEFLFVVGSSGYYWSSTPYVDYNAYGLAFGSGNADWGYGWWIRNSELSVRPVR